MKKRYGSLLISAISSSKSASRLCKQQRKVKAQGELSVRASNCLVALYSSCKRPFRSCQELESMVVYKADVCILYRPRPLMDHVLSCCCPCILFCSNTQACHLPFRFTGVTWSTLHNRWAVYLTIPTEQAGRSKTREFLGCFDTDGEAAAVVDKCRIRHVSLQKFETHMCHCNVNDTSMHISCNFENVTNIAVCTEYVALLLQMSQSVVFLVFW